MTDFDPQTGRALPEYIPPAPAEDLSPTERFAMGLLGLAGAAVMVWLIAVYLTGGAA